jgi:hypothetical protein
MVLLVDCGCDGADFSLAGFATGGAWVALAAAATAWLALVIGLIILEVLIASTIYRLGRKKTLFLLET